MSRLLIFGGTTEGRRLAEHCAVCGIFADVSVVTEYGAGLLPESGYIRALSGQRDEIEIEEMILAGDYCMVIDATHPYAGRISGTLRTVCERHGVRYIRVLRESSALSGTCVESMDELIAYINRRRSGESGLRILSTLGGKSLGRMAGISGFREYVYVRVLPSGWIWEEAERAGFPKEHIIAEKGPFTVEQNIAHIRMCGAGILATKESGAVGGYPEKAEAADAMGIELVTLIRPREEGISLEEALHVIGDTA